MKLNFTAIKSQIETDETKERPLVLLVDDEEPNRRTMSQVLSVDFEVITAEDGEAALDMIRREERSFEVIISDHIMPNMTGVELCTELKRRHHLSERILVTGFAELDSVVSAVNDAAIFRYLTKPVKPAQLVDAVKEASEKYRRRGHNNNLVTKIKSLLEENAQLAKALKAQGFGDQLESRFQSNSGEAKKLEVAVMVLDIRGFTKMSATTPATTVIDVLQRLFEPLHSIIYGSSGIVDKHLGDGMMAIFGLSGAPALQAALGAGRQIVQAYPSILENLAPEFRDLKLSIGIASGEVIVGVVGSNHHSEFTVVGRPSDLAGRLQELSKLALSEQTTCLGSFERIMALCTQEMLVGDSDYEPVTLPTEITIRDFPEIKSLGVLRG
ncbi:MAG: response regulator [Myxococcota bacterium]|nr:response regulator [Myxococcota bacterium]